MTVSWDRLSVGWVGGWLGERAGGGLVTRRGPSRVSQRGSERRCSAIVSGGAARSRLELSHAPTSTSIHLPASASDRFLVWTIRPGCLPPPLPALNPINNAVGSRLRVTAILPAIPPEPRGFRGLPRADRLWFRASFRAVSGDRMTSGRCRKNAVIEILRRRNIERKRYERCLSDLIILRQIDA